MALIQFGDFVRQVTFFCKTLGIKPYDDPGKRNQKRSLIDLSIFYFVIIDLIVVLLGEVGFVVLSFQSGENFIEAVMSLAFIAFGFVGCFKLIVIFRKKSELTKLVAQLYQLFPKTLEEQFSSNIKKYLRQCTKVSLSYAIMNMTLDWLYNLTALVQWLFFGAEQNLPYFMSIPWNWQNHWSYYLIYFVEVCAAYSCTAGQILSDLLLFALATQVRMHYDNIIRQIQAIELKANMKCEKQNVDKKKQYEKDLQFLSELIAYHANVLSLTDIMNDVFGVPLLINFVTSSLIICFVGFEITFGSIDTIVTLLIFMGASLFQVYLICQLGQQLIDSSLNVSLAIFHHNWSNADIRYKKMLVLMIERAQKPANLKATTFVVVSRNSMANLMKISYNFFALLQTMYAE